jgi:N-acylneuraminate cytidylyltransferase
MYQKFKNIAIMPARIGSERIKKKNIKFFYGKPMLHWTYEIIKKSKIFNKIVLTSDCDQILSIGRKIGFDILIKRPKKLSNSNVGIAPVIKHAINYLVNQSIISYQVCCVYPCNPFILVEDLKKAKNLASENINNFIFPVTNYTHPIERSLYLNSFNNKLTYVNKKFIHVRTQDLKKTFYDTGQFYFTSSKTWLDIKKSIYIGIPIPNWRAVDIDTPEDWKRAEILFKTLKKNNNDH